MPYPNFWAARQIDPSQFASFATKKNQGGVGIDFLFGVKKGGGSEIQSIRFDKSKFSRQKAAAWLHKHQYKASIEAIVVPAAQSEASVPTPSHEKLRSLIQEAVDKQYPPVISTDGNNYEGSRMSVMRVFDNEAVLHRGWMAPETDPPYAVTDYAINADGTEATLGSDLTPLDLKLVSADGARSIGLDESVFEEIAANFIEAGRRNSKSDASALNKILQLLMTLVNAEDLEKATTDKMSGMCPTPTQEAWDNSRSILETAQDLSEDGYRELSHSKKIAIHYALAERVAISL